MMYELKCKAIALAVEAQAFKQQEQREKRLLAKWKAKAKIAQLKAAQAGQLVGPDPTSVYSETAQGIHLHRVKDIRKEARNALLAYGFLRGLSYERMENFSWTQPNWDRVEKLAIRYGTLGDEQGIKQRFAEWIDQALGGIAKEPWNDQMVPGTVKVDTLWTQMQDKRNALKVAVEDALIAT